MPPLSVPVRWRSTSIAAPVFDVLDRPVAGVGVSIPDAEQSDARLREVTDRVKAAADTITSRLR